MSVSQVSPRITPAELQRRIEAARTQPQQPALPRGEALPAAPPPTPAPTHEDPVVELQQYQKQQLEGVDALNQTNPLSDGFQANPSGVPQNAQLEQLQKMLSNPAVQGYVKMLSNPKFTESATRVLQHPNRPTLMYAEIVLVVVMLVFRGWRLSKVDRFPKRLWVNFYSWVLTLALAWGVLPVAILGGEYTRMIRMFLDLDR